eukprot:CAMPEP_0202343940 /NCGR_PEP_ID=MMETSP1126-20121109/3838_1 /ASSEMBLY_ACC=CAM_ASM_000457 /TAXON_ID=3047 /ORGANISM="Dunaliella tertiolecta, Strain CCMP1320" /LENGTH=99 /DNA_ID=CAMNT_0048935065 /DNA_START=466 /DNA_END=765 /DNA_ORIENTATION=-
MELGRVQVSHLGNRAFATDDDLKFVQDNTPQLEGRAVQRQGFILPPFSTHVGAVQAVEAVQGVVELRNALAQVLVGFQAQGRHFDKDGVQLAVYHAPEQ